MSWSELRFGKHKGKSLPQVLFSDPDWFFWAYEKKVFHDRLKTEADRIHARATHIRIPDKGDENRVAEYAVHPNQGKFAGMELVPASRPPHKGSTPTFRSKVIDMSIPRRLAPYDKLGCRLLVRSIKFHVFGDEKARMTKERCEVFFDDTSRFALTD